MQQEQDERQLEGLRRRKKKQERRAPRTVKQQRVSSTRTGYAQEVEVSAEERSVKQEQDDSIQLISRRAPAQKYASFEEYMKARGMTGSVNTAFAEEHKQA